MNFRYVFGFIIVVLIIISIVVGTTRTEQERTPRVQQDTRQREEYDGGTPHTPIVMSPQGRRVSKGEAECRRVLERIYNVPFPTVHPEWLTSTETKRRLELDCYAEVGIGLEDKVAIACEYQGQQHYMRVPSMQESDAAFRAQEWNDEYKRRMCELHGVHLIIVPYTVKRNDIRTFITDFLSERSLLPR